MIYLDQFSVALNTSIRQALRKIEQNHYGVILAMDDEGAVMGLATDGDIRRALLKGVSLDDPVSMCINVDFRWVSATTSRESLLKHLDHHIRVIPVLDEARHLCSVISRDHLPLRQEGRVYARARSPVRVSFGGGGSDLTHYFSEEQGAVINATVSLYSHATLRQRSDGRIVIKSLDLNADFEAENLSEALAQRGRFDLILALLRVVQPDFGFELYVHSDFPMGSGLGGSAALSAAVLGCLNMYRRDRWDNHELAEIAFQAERLYMGIAGGWQDQYATAFGGFNFMEFRMDQNIVHPLRIPTDTLLELEESLVLCDTGVAHHSGDIHKNQKHTMQSDDVRRQVQANVALTYEIRNHLLRGRLFEFGKSLHQAWQLKRQFSAMISNESLDRTYAGALENGAIGGKLLGAGGGGFFIFYVPPFRKHELMQYLNEGSLRTHPFRFEPNGLQAWSVREE